MAAFGGVSGWWIILFSEPQLLSIHPSWVKIIRSGRDFLLWPLTMDR